MNWEIRYEGSEREDRSAPGYNGRLDRILAQRWHIDRSQLIEVLGNELSRIRTLCCEPPNLGAECSRKESKPVFEEGSLIFNPHEKWWGILLRFGAFPTLTIDGYYLGAILIFDSENFIGKVICPAMLRDPNVAVLEMEDKGDAPGYVPIDWLFDEKGNFRENV